MRPAEFSNRRCMKMRIGKVVVLVLIIVAAGAYLLGESFLGPPAATSTTTAAEAVPNQLCKGHAKCWEGTVNWIADGDTLEVDSIRIRLALIDAPEQGQPGSVEARDFVAHLCPVGGKAIVDQDDIQLSDNYGRVIAVVWCSGKNLNAEVIHAGLAKIYLKHCHESEFRDEAWARENGCD
jgi:endonuclease YncB( thermonuclease family)